MSRLLVFATLFFTLSGCINGPAPTSPPEPPVDETPGLDTLESWLTGHFSSARQSIEQPTYFDISLAMCPVSAPELGDRVLYVEQAMNGQSPYRQRLYVLAAAEEDDSILRTLVYTLGNPAAFTGTCDQDSVPELTAADALLRDGCDVEMAWNESEQAFLGGTVGSDCASTLQGANHATSEVTLFDGGMHSWDQGWNAAGEQVWGAVDGAYEFDRL